MDIYRVTKRGFDGDKTKLKTRHQLGCTLGYVRSQNAFYEQMGSKIRLSVTVERAPVGEFTDVTAEFLGEGE